MENTVYHPEDFSLYLHVVGGHSLFILLSGGHLLKSSSENEIKFYSTITSPSKFIPRFSGTIKKLSPQHNTIGVFIKQCAFFFKTFINEHQINREDINVENDPLFNDVFTQFTSCSIDEPELSPAQKSKFASLHSELLSLSKEKLKWILFWFIKWQETFLGSDYIILEDLTYEMQSPVIIDIKIGSTPKKSKESNKEKKMNDTTNEIGCRIMGVQKKDVFLHRYSTKHFGMKEFLNELTDFFSVAKRVDIALINKAISEIQSIRNTIQEGLKYKMKFSSLLLVYDYDNHAMMKITLIDFSFFEKCESFTLDAQKDFVSALSNLLEIMNNVASCEGKPSYL